MLNQNEILAVRELFKQFTLHVLGEKVITACENVSFVLRRGEFLGLTGPSGAGKSSVIKCIYRTYLATSGSIIYSHRDGRETDLACAPEREIIRLRRLDIGYASQFLKVMPRVPALDVLAGELRKKGWDMEQAGERAGEYLKMMNIDRTLWDAYPSTFSGGEQQRVNLARALITEPRLLLLDEPTASLDHETKQIVVRVLTEAKKEGTSIIGIFHDLDAMHRLVDRVFVMRAGRCDDAEVRREVI
ncbi:phosphonate C-P lyase system protein PhnL [Desulfoscipio sp. XC116]|uniref:phosphonate C-P lyase system protein PhnL n=1 Tax=Desulfoscipio sp. XC116 TaxID=3144975 RepID=UPI00325ABB6F